MSILASPLTIRLQGRQRLVASRFSHLSGFPQPGSQHTQNAVRVLAQDAHSHSALETVVVIEMGSMTARTFRHAWVIGPDVESKVAGVGVAVARARISITFVPDSMA